MTMIRMPIAEKDNNRPTLLRIKQEVEGTMTAPRIMTI